MSSPRTSGPGFARRLFPYSPVLSDRIRDLFVATDVSKSHLESWADDVLARMEDPHEDVDRAAKDEHARLRGALAAVQKSASPEALGRLKEAWLVCEDMRRELARSAVHDVIATLEGLAEASDEARGTSLPRDAAARLHGGRVLRAMSRFNYPVRRVDEAFLNELADPEPKNPARQGDLLKEAGLLAGQLIAEWREHLLEFGLESENNREQIIGPESRLRQALTNFTGLVPYDASLGFDNGRGL